MGAMQAVGRFWDGGAGDGAGAGQGVTKALRSRRLRTELAFKASPISIQSALTRVSRCLWLPTPYTKAGHIKMEKVSWCP